MRGGNGTKHRYVLDVLSLIELERKESTKNLQTDKFWKVLAAMLSKY